MNDQSQWSEFVKRYSEDKGTIANNGVLSPFRVNQIVPEFITAVKSLEIGGISEPVKTNFGYHIIRLVATTPPSDFETEKAKLIPGNIRQNVTVLGVSGNMSPSEGVNAQTKTITPTKSEQVVKPDSGYTHLLQVTIAAIPASYITTTDANATADDIKSGKTAYVNGKKVTGNHTDPAFSLSNGVLSIV